MTEASTKCASLGSNLAKVLVKSLEYSPVETCTALKILSNHIARANMVEGHAVMAQLDNVPCSVKVTIVCVPGLSI